jgi:phage host-nuclease inhibitor protein Gam
MKRIKLSPSTSALTREDAEVVARQAAILIIQLREAQNDLDQAITHARKQYEGRFSALDTAIKEQTTLLRDWATANPTAFGDKKSLELTHAIIGWRIGNPTLKTLSGWTWDRVLEKLKAIGSQYIRTTEDVHKQQILADRHILGDATLRELGCRVVQDEPFYIEPKLTEQPARITTEAA